MSEGAVEAYRAISGVASFPDHIDNIKPGDEPEVVEAELDSGDAAPGAVGTDAKVTKPAAKKTPARKPAKKAAAKKTAAKK